MGDHKVEIYGLLWVLECELRDDRGDSMCIGFGRRSARRLSVRVGGGSEPGLFGEAI